MALFDLNQWYKEQMPSKIAKGHASTYMTIFSLDEVVEGTLNAGNPLLDVRVDPASISQFTAVQSLEEHYYPSALAFESLCLLGEELVMVNHPGVQRDFLSQLEQSGPNALLHPTKLFHHCNAIGLKPIYTEISSTNCLVVSIHSADWSKKFVNDEHIFKIKKINEIIINIIRVFSPRAGLSLQTQEPRLQFCPKVDLPLQTQEPRLQFYW